MPQIHATQRSMPTQSRAPTQARLSLEEWQAVARGHFAHDTGDVRHIAFVEQYLECLSPFRTLQRRQQPGNFDGIRFGEDSRQSRAGAPMQ
jgi:hypothetical protein